MSEFISPDNTSGHFKYIEKSYTETEIRSSIQIVSSTEQWMDKARCKGMMHLFFQPEKERPGSKEIRESLAKEICELCPVVKQCLDFACKNIEQGIWGGTNEEDRYEQYGIIPYAPINTKYTRTKQ